MKIGLVTGEYPPMEGGVGAFSQELSKALAAQGHEIHIMTSQGVEAPLNRSTNLKRPQALSTTATPRRKPGEPYNLGFAQLYPFINRWRWPSIAKIADWTLRHEFDVVNVQYQAAAYNMNSAAINLLPWRLRGVTNTAGGTNTAGVTTVVTFHDLRVPYLFPKAGRWRRTAVNLMAQNAQGVIVTNPEDYQTLGSLRHWQLCPERRLEQIPIGSNIQAREVTPGEIKAVRQEIGLQAGDCLLGYFGFLNESKGADTLLRALAALPANVHLAFIGGRAGSSDEANNQAFYARLDGLMAELGIAPRVHYTGFVPEHHVSAYLKSVEVMVMPYRDGVSLRRGTLMAALAHGRALITTPPATPTPELVHSENVWLTPADDVPALAQAVKMLLADAGLRAHLGANAAQLAGLFTWEKIAARTAAFFEQLRQTSIA